MFWANVDASRLQADVHPLCAVVALGGGVGIGVNVEGVVGAGLHARLTADAAVLVKVHDAIGPEVERLHGTDFHAGGVGAVVAAHDGEQAAGMGEFAFLHLFHPSPKDTYGYVVFGLASRGAGVAANTLSVVNDKPVLHNLAVGLNSLIFEGVKLVNKSA